MDFSKINTFVLDVDGVLTDGTVIALASGEQARTFLVKDGYAVEKAIQKGYNVVIITGGFQEGVKKRLSFLGVKDIYSGVKDKVKVLNEYLSEKNIDLSQVLYMGDDLPDYDVMKIVGIATCPADATQEIKEISQYISTFNGGKGAVRDIIEQVLKSQGTWVISGNMANA
jgi:3-deoxy-D-manno-octulosonate 8-phosphate phosphatase (KDO 8-P phosphatase)